MAMARVGIVAAIAAASLFAFRSGSARLFEHQPSGFFDGRLQTWADGWELFRRYPLCGIGPNTFYDPLLNPLYVERDQLGIAYVAFYHAHNIFLNTLAEGGIHPRHPAARPDRRGDLRLLHDPQGRSRRTRSG